MTKITKTQERFLIALMETNTITEACERANITTPTGHKYLNNSIFKAEYKRIRSETLAMATNRLQRSAIEAVETLNSIMINEDSPASSRVQAARAVLENAYKAYDLEENKQRLDELEKIITEYIQDGKRGEV